MFGLREVLVLGPGGEDRLGNDTRAKMVLGAINIALSNTNCPLPCLVKVMDPSKELYVGSCVADNARTELSSVCLNKKPAHCNHLAGLLEIFRNKINSPLPVPTTSSRVSVRLSYRLEDWTSFSWTIDPPDLDIYILSGDTDFIQLAKLPFGCVSDPIAGLTLHTTWRDMSEDLVTDTEVHSDLDPLEAPDWSVEVSLVDRPDCLLAKHLDKHLQLCSDRRTLRMLIGDLLDESEADPGVSQVLDKMSGVGGSYGLSDLSGLVRPLRRSPTGGPLKPGLVKFVLGYLFPDSSETSSQHQYGEFEELPGLSQKVADLYTGLVKTAPPSSLVWRLSHASACCLQWAGAAGVAHMWHEVCLELRYRLENNILIPGLPSGLPDTSYCLLLQKLQMLNCCVARKLARETAATKTEDLNKRIDINEEVEDSEDEFFECEEEVQQDKKKAAPVWAEAEGRVGRIGELRLLEVDDWMYRPEVQDPPPVTEDQLAELSEVMMQLGTDQAGAEIRAKMQSANLMSDMESFKAANPGCVLADFVRWHSPRDWDTERGLSCRMKSEGNIWALLWEQARTVPARRQRRLFDDTKEAEKVMTFLTGLSAGDLASLLHPVLLHAAHLRLLEASHDCQDEEEDRDQDKQLVQNIISLAKLQSLAEVRHYRGEVEDQQFERRQVLSSQISSMFWLLEMRTSRSLSLRKKFLYDLAVLSEEERDQPDAVREMERFVRTLATGTEVRVLGAARGPAGRLIQSMFREVEQDGHPRETGLPPPSTKQFIIRSLVPRPLPYSRPQPQRLYARLASGEFRLAGSFTSDRQYS